jgi:hypothetical protein
VTEYLYSVPAKSVNAKLKPASAGAFLDDQPSMTDCVTPRTLGEIVKRCAEGNKSMTLRDEMRRTINALDQATGSTLNQECANRALALLESKTRGFPGAVV